MMHSLLCFGDSNTYGYTAQGSRFAHYLQWPYLYHKALGKNWQIKIDAACGRYLIAPNQAPSLLHGQERLFNLLEENPVDRLILQLGTNDLLSGEMGAEALVVYFRQLADHLNQQYPKMHYCFISPSFSESQALSHWTSHSYQMLLRKTTKLQKGLHSLALPLLSSDALEKSPCDGVHFTALGHRQLAKALLRYFL